MLGLFHVELAKWSSIQPDNWNGVDWRKNRRWMESFKLGVKREEERREREVVDVVVASREPWKS